MAAWPATPAAPEATPAPARPGYPVRRYALTVAVVLVLLLVLPVIEVYLFVQVASAIGFWNAIGIVILISLVGIWLVKRAGMKVWARFNEQLVAHRTPTKEVADGVLLLIAGSMLVFPGFLTDALGLLLLLPPVRALSARRLIRRYSGRADFRVIKASYGSSDGDVIDTGGVERPPPPKPPGELAGP